jgi:hypothetical protein
VKSLLGDLQASGCNASRSAFSARQSGDKALAAHHAWDGALKSTVANDRAVFSEASLKQPVQFANSTD